MSLLSRIAVDPQVRFGKPCVRGTRITVGEVLGFLASGEPEKELLTEFPQLAHEDVLACFAFAAERERRLLVVPVAEWARLLLDENLSERLLTLLSAHFPESLHVRLIGLSGASDQVLRSLAAREGLLLVTKDEDLVALSGVNLAPPQVIWLNVGNAGTRSIAALLLSRVGDIEAFVDHHDAAFLALAIETRSR